MKCLSSRKTFFYKRVFPVIWFGFLGVIFVPMVLSSAFHKIPAPELIIPIVMAVFGYVLMRQLVFGLADEVWDNGGSLTVVNKGVKEEIALSRIININYMGMSNPSRITLLLDQPGGRTIAFMPARQKFRLNCFSHPVADDLIARIHAKKI